MFNFIDKILIEIGQAITSINTNSNINLKEEINENQNKKIRKFNKKQLKHISGLMRVNHCGEICAQALYRGQAFFLKNKKLKKYLYRTAIEENDHLILFHKRLKDLQSYPTLLNPFFYIFSFNIGVLTSFFGKKIILGFIQETEKQVVQHLDNHIKQILYIQDYISYKILKKIKDDEIYHAKKASYIEEYKLPSIICSLMKYLSKIMTIVTYYI